MTDAHKDETCAPFRIDFDRLAGQVAENETVKERTANGRKLASVEHTIHHLREETHLEDRQIAKVLLTTSVLFMDLMKIDRQWNPIFFANLLALCGQQLWHDDHPRPQPSQPPEPQSDDPSRWWAVWKPDGTLHAVREYAEPRLGGEVLMQLTADSELGPFDLEPVTKPRAEELREQVRQVRR